MTGKATWFHAKELLHTVGLMQIQVHEPVQDVSTVTTLIDPEDGSHAQLGQGHLHHLC